MKESPKYAVITGASSGIGWCISDELAKKAYSIVAISNQAVKLKRLKSELENKYPVNVHIIDCDLTQYDAAQCVFDYCQKKNLMVEVLVNNAGILVFGDVVRIDIKNVKNILQLHMNTPVMLCRLFGEVMVKNRKGYILNISSISSVMPYPLISLYGPTKTFLRKFTRAFRTEMKGNGVSVSCLLPGATATALYDANKINIPLALKLGIMKKPEFSAKVGVAALFKKKAEVIPGLLNKITMLFIPLFPHFIISLIYRKKKNAISKFF